VHSHANNVGPVERSMTAAIILQARMASTRLHGKVLQRAAGRSILEWVIRASQKVPGIDVVCVAVPYGETNEPIVVRSNNLAR
jgi:spore coat polysaccharide biosynthesis protein SpsF